MKRFSRREIFYTKRQIGFLIAFLAYFRYLETMGIPHWMPYTFFLFPLVITGAALYFRKRQNTLAQVGGIISYPKSFWLSYTVLTWFLYPFLFIALPLHPLLESIIILHLVSFWIRGILELFMIYKWFNWSPLYGISHSGLHFFAILFLVLKGGYEVTFGPNLLAFIFVLSLLVTVGFETVFALLFFKIRGKEKHKIYFASDEPIWKRVNQLTAVAVLLGFGFHAVCTLVSFQM